jgi:hypothetical protein
LNYQISSEAVAAHSKCELDYLIDGFAGWNCSLLEDRSHPTRDCVSFRSRFAARLTVDLRLGYFENELEVASTGHF